MASETSKPTVSSTNGHNGDVDFASRRLAQEARQALSYGGRGVTDVTEDFAVASHKLPVGQLVKDEDFTLFEAVGALEVGTTLMHLTLFDRV